MHIPIRAFFRCLRKWMALIVLPLQLVLISSLEFAFRCLFPTFLPCAMSDGDFVRYIHTQEQAQAELERQRLLARQR